MVYFMYPGSGLDNQIIRENADGAVESHIPQTSSIQQPATQLPQSTTSQESQDKLTSEAVQEQSSELHPAPNADPTPAQAEECARLGIDFEDCTENAILAAHGGSGSQSTGTEAIRLSNSHIWVSANGTSSVAGFVVQNTGSGLGAIHGITIRGQSVPTSSWYYNSADATAVNIKKELKSDFVLNAVNVDGVAGEESFVIATGPILLAPGQAVFVYLANPSGISAIDGGLSFTINVQAGKASAVQSISVVNG